MRVISAAMKKHTETLLVRMPPELRAGIDEWRREQRPLPSEAEAVRQLIDAALSRPRTPEPASSGRRKPQQPADTHP
jgi:Arc/MetJ-type ribon-helix-helix transcriptional regulator